jgi:hypothetical protein
MVSPSVRAALTLDDMPKLLEDSGSSSTLSRWQAVIARDLVLQPTLIWRRPRILLAGTQELRESHITKFKSSARISATCELTADVGTRKVHAFFATISGKNPILFQYEYPHPTIPGKMEEAGEHVDIEPVYKAYEVTADESEKQPTPRNLDADKKLIDSVHDLLHRVCLHYDTGLHLVTGTLAMTTEIRMCTSCYLVALQFLTNFPKLDVTVNKL